MQVYFEKGKYHENAKEIFSFNKLDAFHSEDILNCSYGDNWNSILITEGNNAFIHAFSKNKIDGTEYFDIEPHLGYSGPIVKFNSPEFVKLALNKYSEICREENVVAELFRFNPLLCNHSYFKDYSELKVVAAKEIVISDCFEDEDKQLAGFSKIGRYEAKKGMIKCKFKIKGRDESFAEFRDLYNKSLERTGAGKEWYFSDQFFENVKKTGYFDIRSVYNDDIVISSALVIFFPFTSYYLLAANSEEKPLGANNFLLLKIAAESAKRGIYKLILGGGVTSEPDDSLFRFKKKFSKKTETFYIGKLVHNEDEYNKLCNDAVSLKPEIKNSNILLKYRIV